VRSFTIGIAAGLLGLTGPWALLIGAPLVAVYLFWRDVRSWWRRR
jgi:hypothetical protein